MMKTLVLSGILVSATEAGRTTARLDDGALTAGNETLKCDYSGPEGTGIFIAFPVDNCNDCSQSLYQLSLKEERLEKPFRMAMKPTLLDHTVRGRDLCACYHDDQVKLVMETRRGQCKPDLERTQETCWRIFKKILGMTGQANEWKRTSKGCVPCIGEDCNHIEMQKEIDGQAIGRLQMEAKTDELKATTLAKIERLGAVTAKYTWMFKGWTPCTAPCGGGLKFKQYKCVKDGESTHELNRKVCEVFVGEEPKEVPEDCNLQPCTTYEWQATDDWEECSKKCRDTEGAGSQSRLYKCVKRAGDDADWETAGDGDCTSNGKGAKPSEERACSQDPCTYWKASVYCEDVDGEMHEDGDGGCEMPAPTLKDFMKLDVNGDGTLTPEELMEWRNSF